VDLGLRGKDMDATRLIVIYEALLDSHTTRPSSPLPEMVELCRLTVAESSQRGHLRRCRRWWSFVGSRWLSPTQRGHATRCQRLQCQ
jgi:hypothetical protein